VSVPAGFAACIVDWQRTHGRHTLPWQNTRDPYRVWLSEIMLQQTQVAAVLGYYARFLERFPDVQALAAAPVGDVLAAWSGLGYYSRARNLHRCAQAVVERHGGAFPPSAAALQELPGIGRSTAAAIAAFCFGERAAILDGNVKRVLTRVLGFAGDLAEAKQERALWDAATSLLPEREIERYTQGLMDLGATVCAPRAPQCLICPAQPLCAAAREGAPERYPVKTRKLRRSTRTSVWLLLEHRARIFLVEREHRGVWAGLWSLPEFAPDEAVPATAGWPGEGTARPSFVHVLTHLEWTLHPLHWRLPARLPDKKLATVTAPWPAGRWFTRDEALALGLPAPLRRLLNDLVAAQVVIDEA
jgi:A/G-specific adenine glycosylase